jgi:hypothetical protein
MAPSGLAAALGVDHGTETMPERVVADDQNLLVEAGDDHACAAQVAGHGSSASAASVPSARLRDPGRSGRRQPGGFE